MIPNYRKIHKIKNKPGTPKAELKCEYCHDLLTKENRSKVSNMVVCLEQNIYQICKDCRLRFYGNVTDLDIMHWAYKMALRKRK